MKSAPASVRSKLKQGQPVTHLSETIPTASSAAGIPMSRWRLDPCPHFWTISSTAGNETSGKWHGEECGSRWGGPLSVVLPSMRSDQGGRRTLRGKGERSRRGGDWWKQNVTELTAHWKRRGGRQEKNSHIQAAHFLTNYCKTSLSPSF